MANERRLIDANELLLHAEQYRCGRGEYSRMVDVWYIENAPTVDAVEVVRCEDCKHYFHYGKTSLVVDGKNVKAGWCQRRMRYEEEIRMLPNDFCSYGGKREVE